MRHWYSSGLRAAAASSCSVSRLSSLTLVSAYCDRASRTRRSSGRVDHSTPAGACQSNWSVASCAAGAGGAGFSGSGRAHSQPSRSLPSRVTSALSVAAWPLLSWIRSSCRPCSFAVADVKEPLPSDSTQPRPASSIMGALALPCIPAATGDPDEQAGNTSLPARPLSGEAVAAARGAVWGSSAVDGHRRLSTIGEAGGVTMRRICAPVGASIVLDCAAAGAATVAAVAPLACPATT
eukprot:scaffold28558_cov101-Isochrysis_galbana.AAC.3